MRSWVFSSLLGFPLFAFAIGQPAWHKPVQPPAAHQIISVIADSANSSAILAATNRQLFRKGEIGRWEKICDFPSRLGNVTRLMTFRHHPDYVYALTDRGIFKGRYDGTRWESFFRGKNDHENHVLSLVTITGESTIWFAGTQGGLFESRDQGRHWKQIDFFGEEMISLVSQTGQGLFVILDDTLYVSDDWEHFQKSLALSSAIEDALSGGEENILSVAEVSSSDSGLGTNGPSIFDLAGEGQTTWLATKNGVFERQATGKSWRRLSESGLLDIRVEHLAFAPMSKLLFAASKNSIFQYDSVSQRWTTLHKGFTPAKVFDLSVIEREQAEVLLALTSDGLMEFPVVPPEIIAPAIWIPAENQIKLFEELLALEPTARDVQKMVIDYAHVKNSKITRWHWLSRLKALIPSFDFGYDASRSNNIDLDRGSTNDPDVYILGPENISKGWDWSIHWQLEDLLFNSSQTSIDSREKLMVELRQDLLSEATRIYYERRRLQTEFVFSPAEFHQEHLDRLTRLDELTSLLDAFTDGEFGEKLEEMYERNPALKGLWSLSGGTPVHQNTIAPANQNIKNPAA
ncbi:MAG: hypothetical protein JW893_07800 [Candidatus Omnitrophica bacterium]|nr:hypothetical protein [Candidatus Omnitrophota bacterium]